MYSRVLVKWKFVPLLLSYCCAIYDRKDISSRRNVAEASRFSIKHKVSENDIIVGQVAGERKLRNKKICYMHLFGSPKE